MGPAYWILTTVIFFSLAILVLALNYLAHKEYTAEIERLRRDLQATRDKNGVYLANENYTKMTLQIEQQEQEISQYLGQIKALREEMEKKEEICNQLNMSLEICNDKLASTFAELGDTQEKLMNTINVCSEKCHLLNKHMETEEKLSMQAQSLLAVADMASTDTEKLHDKLARKRSVESENEDTTRHFHTSFVQNIAHMQDNVNRFSQDLTKFCLGLQTNLGERLEKRSVELTALSNEMSSFVYNGQQLIQQFLTTVRSTSDTEVNNLHTFLTETFLAPMRSMSRQLQLIESETQTFSRTVLEQLQQQMDGMKTFETSQKDALSQLRDNTLLQFKQQEQSLEQSEEGAFTSEVQQLKSWADRVLSMYGEFDMHYSDNKSKIKSGLSTAKEKCDHLSQVTSSTLEQQLKRRAEHISTYETQTEEMIDSISNSRQTLDQLISGTKRLDEELEAGIRLSVSNGERAWRNHYSWTEQELRKYSENLNGELQRELKQTQDLMTGLRESAESHEAILEQQRIDFGTFVRERQDDLDSQCSYISSWTQSTVSELQLRNQDVDKFLVEDLRRDIATERRGFVYPRALAATSPHERILARYREMNDAAASFKLPKEDSKLSRSDNKENSRMASMKKYHSEDLKTSKQLELPKRTPGTRKALVPQN
ncbi:hypothetical protein C0J52_10095 [Blattella germanica]|nr:hypothetical protein C0J52_10095 [Blattella germanica]